MVHLQPTYDYKDLRGQKQDELDKAWKDVLRAQTFQTLSYPAGMISMPWISSSQSSGDQELSLLKFLELTIVPPRMLKNLWQATEVAV